MGSNPTGSFLKRGLFSEDCDRSPHGDWQFGMRTRSCVSHSLGTPFRLIPTCAVGVACRTLTPGSVGSAGAGVVRRAGEPHERPPLAQAGRLRPRHVRAHPEGRGPEKRRRERGPVEGPTRRFDKKGPISLKMDPLGSMDRSKYFG